MSLRPLLVGARVRLAPVNPDEAEVWAKWTWDADFKRFLDSDPAMPSNAQNTRKFMEQLADEKPFKTSYDFAIRLLADDSPLGFIGLNGIQWTHGTAWLGVGLAPDVWGQGYGSEAMPLMLDFGFDELNLHRIQLNVFEYNPRAIALYEKLGFVREGVQREAILRGGRRYDFYYYGLLAREWRGKSRG